MSFKTSHSLATRQQESSRIFAKFPGRIPIIVERGVSSQKTMPLLDKQKYLVPSDLTLGQFTFVIRKRMELPSERALFLFVDNTLPTTGSLMREVYAQHYDKEDGFLYVVYCGENTFGVVSN
jgi:GABA(A) receptor-associated protein